MMKKFLIFFLLSPLLCMDRDIKEEKKQREVRYRGDPIEKIPKDMLLKLKDSIIIVRLSFVGAGLKLLEPRQFDFAPLLEKLDLSNNELEEIPAGAFSSLKKLKDLNLSGNKLRAMDPGWDEDLHNLKVICLSKNRLDSVPTFSTTRNLLVLKLDHNTIQGVLPAKIFKILIRLQALNLAHNNITDFQKDWNEGLEVLQELDMAHNALSYLRVYQFKHFLQIGMRYDFSYNSLRHVEFDTSGDNNEFTRNKLFLLMPDYLNLSSNYLEGRLLSKLRGMGWVKCTNNPLREQKNTAVVRCNTDERLRRELYARFPILTTIESLKQVSKLPVPELKAHLSKFSEEHKRRVMVEARQGGCAQIVQEIIDEFNGPTLAEALEYNDAIYLFGFQKRIQYRTEDIKRMMGLSRLEKSV